MAWLLARGPSRPFHIWPAACGDPTMLFTAVEGFIGCYDISPLGPAAILGQRSA